MNSVTRMVHVQDDKCAILEAVPCLLCYTLYATSLSCRGLVCGDDLIDKLAGNVPVMQDCRHLLLSRLHSRQVNPARPSESFSCTETGPISAESRGQSSDPKATHEHFANCTSLALIASRAGITMMQWLSRRSTLT